MMKQDTKTRMLLTCGVLAGPVYVLTSVMEMLIRPGFNPTRHDWSLMSNGSLGWIHIANFLITGTLVLAAAWGIRRALKGGTAGTWAPLLLGLYGLGLIGAGLFVADPMHGFPLGTPEGAPAQPTFHGMMHIVSGAVGFVGLIAACFVTARYFKEVKQQKLALFSRLTGVIFLAGFFAIAMGSQQTGVVLQVVTLAFTAAVVCSWVWLSCAANYLKRVA